MNATISWRIELTQFSVQRIASGLLAFQERRPQPTPEVLAPDQFDVVQRDLGLTTLQAKIRQQGAERDFGLGILGMPDVPALVGRILRLVGASPAGERLLKQFRDDGRRFGEADLDDVVVRRRAIDFHARPGALADTDKSVRVDGPSEVRVSRFHTPDYTPLQQWGDLDEHGKRVGKKVAGRILDGRTWDEFPTIATPAGAAR